ncbi:MAG: segregation and condensation protein B [Planctomycetota bacterium]|jgi:segregation and condensation protein B
MITSITLSAQIEGLLFFLTKPVHIDDLVSMLDTDKASLEQALHDLRETMIQRGIVLMEAQDKISLRSHPSLAPVIERVTKQERSAPLSRAALETLAIILYQGEAAKADIDYIRGVNAQFMLRNLLVRGLVKKVAGKDGNEASRYSATEECLAYMGVTDATDLPDYEKIAKALEEEPESSENDPS